jgi:hypothetical protein
VPDRYPSPPTAGRDTRPALTPACPSSVWSPWPCALPANHPGECVPPGEAVADLAAEVRRLRSQARRPRLPVLPRPPRWGLVARLRALLQARVHRRQGAAAARAQRAWREVIES